MIFDLVPDFGAVLDVMPPGHPGHRPLRLLAEGVRRNVYFIDHLPTTLFQCLWNSCWWYDYREAADVLEAMPSGNPDGQREPVTL